MSIVGDYEKSVPVAFNQGSTLLVKVSIPIGGGYLSRIGYVQLGGADIQMFIRCVQMDAISFHTTHLDAQNKHINELIY